MMTKFWFLALSGAIGLFSLVAPGLAQEPYYKEKTIRIVTGSSAGGLFDTYSRIIARRLGRYIPGNPTVIVENLPGAGGLILANRLYNAVKPDGLTIGHFPGTWARNQVLGQTGIEFDAPKFQWIGTPARVTAACVTTKASGITSIQAWMNSPKPVRFGSLGPGSDLYDTPRVLEAALGLPTQVLVGYKGAAEVRLAAEGGEVDGVCWDGTSAQRFWPRQLETGEVKVVLQIAPRPLPHLPGVPNAIDLAKSQESRRLIEAGIHDAGALLLTYAMPPATPKELVQTIRQALLATLKDPQVLADAKKAVLAIDPISGEELERIVAGLFKLEPAIVSKLKTLLVPGTK